MRKSVFALMLVFWLAIACGTGEPPAPTLMLSANPSFRPTALLSNTPLSPMATPVAVTATPGDRIRPADGMAMIYVPGGTFLMGSTEAQLDIAKALCDEYPDDYGKCKEAPFDGESPQHTVTLDDFWLDRTEVTNAQYALCVEKGACRASRLANNPNYSGDDYPVAGIPRQDAADYCAWAGGRLPTEAEWEFAARGAKGSTFPWGDEFACDGGNLWDPGTGCDDGYPEPAPVGSFPEGASWCGALDMAGNVWEWVADAYGPYSTEAQVNPTGQASGNERILRGGSWGYLPAFSRTAYRYPVPPTADYLAVGFRCAASADDISMTAGPAGTGNVVRTVLTYDELMNGFDADSPVDDDASALPDDAAPSEHIFEGRLELFGEDASGDAEMVRGELEPENTHLPEFDFEFVQLDSVSDGGSYLIPTQRGQIIADHPKWNYVIGPGRVWRENGDQGYSRASFPFALVWRGGNATFNGTMMFLFDDESVSKVWYQITQETTTYTRANLWGLLEAAYHPESIEGADQVRADFAQELADRFPTKPIAQLVEDYPGTDISAFGRGVSPEHRTMYGFVINGVNYVGECQTRFGHYDYCDWMRATSYSTAKSAFVSLALMRLAQKYGPGVADLLIKDYVPEYAASPGDWQRVTFNNTLDMATGNYRAAGHMTDEDGEQMNEFWDAQPYSERIAAAFDWPHSAEPGTQWVYRTSDTFILTRALHNYLQSQEGSEADIFEFVVNEVYKPLKIGPGAHTTMRTADNNWQGQPEGGYGLWWIQDDIAKIATLLHDGGQIGGEQILHPGLLAATLQQDPDDRGVDIGTWGKYNNAFWAQRYGKADGYDCEFWVPTMQGVSGNVVALMPNGTTYYYFSDNQQFTWDAAVRESNRIVPHCP